MNGVTGDGEKERSDGADFIGRLGSEKANVGFLSGVIGVRGTGQGLAKIGPERIVVRLNLPGKPLGMVCVRYRTGRCGERGICGRLAQDKDDRQAMKPKAGSSFSRARARIGGRKLFSKRATCE